MLSDHFNRNLIAVLPADEVLDLHGMLTIHLDFGLAVLANSAGVKVECRFKRPKEISLAICHRIAVDDRVRRLPQEMLLSELGRAIGFYKSPVFTSGQVDIKPSGKPILTLDGAASRSGAKIRCRCLPSSFSPYLYRAQRDSLKRCLDHPHGRNRADTCNDSLWLDVLRHPDPARWKQPRRLALARYVRAPWPVELCRLRASTGSPLCKRSSRRP